jgi:hypothetical protein
MSFSNLLIVSFLYITISQSSVCNGSYTCKCSCCFGPNCRSMSQAIAQPTFLVTTCDSCSVDICRTKYPTACPSTGTNLLLFTQCESSTTSVPLAISGSSSTAVAPLVSSGGGTCKCSCCIGCGSSAQAIAQPAFPVTTCSSNTCSQNVCANKYPSACPSTGANGVYVSQCISSSTSDLTPATQPPAASNSKCQCSCCTGSGCTPVAQPTFLVPICGLCLEGFCAAAYPTVCLAPGSTASHTTQAKCSSSALAIQSLHLFIAVITLGVLRCT